MTHIDEVASHPRLRSFAKARNVSRADVIVVGAGPAGSATALALARAGREVMVLDRSCSDSPRVGEVLPPEISGPLAELGVWGRFLADGHTPSPGITSVWGGPERLENDFITNPHGLGWHIDRVRFDAMLAEAAEESGATILWGARPVDWGWAESDGAYVAAVVGDARVRVRGRAIVDATGRSAVVARRLGARRILHDRLVGLWGLCPHADAGRFHDRRTLVEAVADGWWYSARLPGCRQSAALMTDSDLLPRGRGALSVFWRRSLERAHHTRARLWCPLPGAPMRIVSARTSRLSRIAGLGWLAVGDAALSFDPLSSQGVTWALESGLAAARALDALLGGDAGAVDDYAHRARIDFADYLRGRREMYGRERRWPESAFWRRRHGAGGLRRPGRSMPSKFARRAAAGTADQIMQEPP